MRSLKWPLAIFCFSLLTHIPGITNPILDQHAWAQTLRAALARNYAEGGMNLWKPQADYVETGSHDRAPQFPLYSYLVAVLYKIFGIHDFLGRILSAFFAGLSAGALYFLAGELEEETLARVSALVFCLIPLRVYFMRAFMPESMAIFCLIAGFYSAILWMKSEKYIPCGFLATGFLTLVPLLKIAYFPLVLVPLLYIYKERRSFLSRLDFLLSAFFLAAAVFSWYLYANYGMRKSEGFALQLFGEMAIFRVWASPTFWADHFLSRFPELLTTYGGLLFFFVGLKLFWAGRRIFWILWFLLTVAAIALCGEYGRIHQYASLPFAPVNAVFISAGILEIFRAWRGKKFLLALWFVLVLSIPVHSALRIRHWYRLDEAWVLRAGRIVDAISQPRDLFFVNSQDQPFYLYHIHRKGYAARLEGEGLHVLEEAISEGAKFLLSPNHLTTMNWEAAEPAIARRFPVVYRDQDFAIYDLRRRQNEQKN